MKPGLIIGSNFTYKAPPGMPDCADLHVLRTTISGMPAIQSAWQLDDEERKAISDGRDIILTVIGNGQPPVALNVSLPVCDVCGEIMAPGTETPMGGRHQVCNDVVTAGMTDAEKEAAVAALAGEVGDYLRDNPDKYVELEDGTFLPRESVASAFAKLKAQCEAARMFAVNLMNEMDSIPERIENAARSAGVID